MKNLTEEQKEIHEDYITHLKETWENTKQLNELDKKDIEGFLTSHYDIPIQQIDYSELSQTPNYNTRGIQRVSSLPTFYIPSELEDNRELFEDYIKSTKQDPKLLGSTTSEKNILTRLFSSGKLLSVQFYVTEESNIEENPQYIQPDNGGIPIHLEAKDKIIRTYRSLFIQIIIPYKLPQLFDDDEKLHSLERAASSSFLHGDSYCIHGIKFEKLEWGLVSSRRMPVMDILGLKNVEQRRVALELYGPEVIVKNSVLLDESKRGNKLYDFAVKSNRFSGGDFHIHILQYKDPSTERIYNSFVPPTILKADEGMAWKFDITEEEYAELKVEK